MNGQPNRDYYYKYILFFCFHVHSKPNFAKVSRAYTFTHNPKTYKQGKLDTHSSFLTKSLVKETEDDLSYKVSKFPVDNDTQLCLIKYELLYNCFFLSEKRRSLPHHIFNHLKVSRVPL